VCGGMGRVAEHLSESGCDVTLLEPTRLCFSYRRNIVPNTKVKGWNIDPSTIKLNKKTYDYVIIRGSAHRDLAIRVAKVAIIDLSSMKVDYVGNNPEIPTPAPEIIRVIEPDKGNETSHILPDTTSQHNEAPSISNDKFMESME